MLRVQRYVSDELTHFVGRSRRNDLEAHYALFLKIIRGGLLTHPPHNPEVSGNLMVRSDAKISGNEMYIPQMVCFCDIPMEDLGIHASKYGRFGLAFKKSYAAGQGASPVFYVAKSSSVWAPRESSEIDPLALDPRDQIMKRVSRADHFDEMVSAHHREYQSMLEQRLEELVQSGSEPIRVASRIQRFLAFNLFAYLKFFDESKVDDDPDNYYMEREWRVLGNVQFTLEDVARV